MAYQVKLDSFEGPLDLLLYLIRKSNIDVYDIPISEITAQYLDYLDIMEKLNLDVAGEFLVMSATLIYIKSEMLLPRPEIEGEDEDPRDELVNKLLEYEKIKEVSKTLREKEAVQREVFTRNRIAFSEQDYVIDASLFDLLDAFKKIVSRAEDSIKEIIQEEIKVEDRIAYIMDILEEKEWIEFSAMFAKLNMSRQLIVVTFIALLELVRQKKIYARQAEHFKEIRIYKKSDSIMEQVKPAEAQGESKPEGIVETHNEASGKTDAVQPEPMNEANTENNLETAVTEKQPEAEEKEEVVQEPAADNTEEVEPIEGDEVNIDDNPVKEAVLKQEEIIEELKEDISRDREDTEDNTKKEEPGE